MGIMESIQAIKGLFDYAGANISWGIIVVLSLCIFGVLFKGWHIVRATTQVKDGKIITDVDIFERVK